MPQIVIISVLPKKERKKDEGNYIGNYITNYVGNWDRKRCNFSRSF